jgi:anti-sigma factor RsiW
MRCHRVRRLLALHVGGDLDPGHRSAVEEHLESCSPCRERLRSFERSRQALFALKGATGPAPDLWPAVRAGLDRRAKVRWGAGVAAAAVLLLAVGAGLLALRGGEEEPPTGPVVTTDPVPEDPGRFLLAEVGPSAQVVAPCPTVSPVDPERSTWDDF